MKPLRLVVVGTMASDPYAGMAWMHVQFVEGLRRLGHDVYYFETTSSWPYDPERESRVDDSDHALAYLKTVLESFGLGGCWAYRRSYSDKQWFGMDKTTAEEMLAQSDAVFNISGATRFAEEQLTVGNLVFIGTDPVAHEIGYNNGEEDTCSLIDEHRAFVTYGENIGTPASPIPPLPNLKGRMRQPVLIDMWRDGAASRPYYTTVCNWTQRGEITFRGEPYYWSKDREFLKFIDLPSKSGKRIELALGGGPAEELICFLQGQGWGVTNAAEFTRDPWQYRDYIRASRAEFTVAKDQNVRLRSGWFSERSACYLASGRPVITQNTGFGNVLPCGEGLFAFDTMDEILSAFEAIESDYDRHSRAASEIAQEYFAAETVLGKMLSDLGIS